MSEPTRLDRMRCRHPKLEYTYIYKPLPHHSSGNLLISQKCVDCEKEISGQKSCYDGGEEPFDITEKE